MIPRLRRIGGAGRLVLIGGGEFSFEETEHADAAWLATLDAESTVGFLPAASGSEDYAQHFAVYLDEYFERRVETLPVYRARDARRGKNAERIDAVGGVYIGGGVADRLVEALADTPCLEALARCLERGGTVTAIAAGAQALGHTVRGIFGGETISGLDWLRGGVVETNFDLPGSKPHFDRRLRRLVGRPGVSWGLGIPAGSAVLLGPPENGGDDEPRACTFEVQGRAFWLGDPEGELIELSSTDPPLAERKI